MDKVSDQPAYLYYFDVSAQLPGFFLSKNLEGMAVTKSTAH
jgi:hypothetical protein